ncbi:hypothetical protein RhiXN_06652 [Rhizoctonia solani]|uniref:Uncharacterized protein n=1 Tax=Rhizoctonia solani TaxID=456999 RepID=A0A8H8NZB5_9AGAM|nr:uncharacterized protein RhiXN_06652 [Rhizoctonia solani]QRW21663.1 hypothetical protein RhiXN_06652 [Rhizoctonia solani]
MKPKDFEIRLAGRQGDNPVDGLLGIDDCALELKKVEFGELACHYDSMAVTSESSHISPEIVIYEYGEIRIKSSTQTSRDINVEKILFHGRVVPAFLVHRFNIPTNLPGAIKCHKDPASVVWKLNICVSRKKPTFSHDPHIESYQYSGARSFLPHTLITQPHILQGRDDKRGVAWDIEFPRSFFAAGECLSGKITLRRFSAKSKFSLRNLYFELSEHVITRASAIAAYGDVQEYRGSRTLVKSKIVVDHSFGSDGSLAVQLPMSLPQDCTPDYSGPHVFVMHRVVIKTKSKHGVEADHLTQFPLRIVAVAFEERVRLTSGKKGTEISSRRKDADDPAPAYIEKVMAMAGAVYDQPPPPFSPKL